MTYILNHAGAKVVVVCGAPQLEKLLACRARLPDLEHIIVADGRSRCTHRVPSLRNADRFREWRGNRRLSHARLASSPRPTRLHHLHLRHHWRAQGRDAHAHQHLFERHRFLVPSELKSGVDSRPVLPPPGAYLRPHHGLRHALQRHLDRLRRGRQLFSPRCFSKSSRPFWPPSRAYSKKSTPASWKRAARTPASSASFLTGR